MKVSWKLEKPSSECRRSTLARLAECWYRAQYLYKCCFFLFFTVLSISIVIIIFVVYYSGVINLLTTSLNLVVAVLCSFMQSSHSLLVFLWLFPFYSLLLFLSLLFLLLCLFVILCFFICYIFFVSCIFIVSLLHLLINLKNIFSAAAYISLTSIVLVDLMGWDLLIDILYLVNFFEMKMDASSFQLLSIQLVKFLFHVRLDNLTSAFGLLTLFRGFSSMIGPPINGRLSIWPRM